MAIQPTAHSTAQAMPAFVQVEWTETGETVETEVTGGKSPIICPRCAKIARAYSPNIPLCAACYWILWQAALAWTDREALRSWLHSRLDANGYPVASATVDRPSEYRELFERRQTARRDGIDWRTVSARMTTAQRLKLLVDAVVSRKPSPFPVDGAKKTAKPSSKSKTSTKTSKPARSRQASPKATHTTQATRKRSAK